MEKPKEPSTGKSTRAEPRKHLWVDVGVKVMVPLSTPIEELHATTSQVLTTVQDAVRKALEDYKKAHKRNAVDFEMS